MLWYYSSLSEVWASLGQTDLGQMHQWQISTVSKNKERAIKVIENCMWNIITPSVFLVNVENITPTLLSVGLEVKGAKICSDSGEI